MKLINDDYQEDIDDILIFNVNQDVHVNDTLTFNVHLNDGSFDTQYDSMSYYYDNESSTKRIIKNLDISFKKDGCIIIKNLDLSFKEDGCIKRYYFEDLFDDSCHIPVPKLLGQG